MSKNTSNGNVKVAWVPDLSVLDPETLTAGTLNGDGLGLNAAIAWADYSVGAGASGDLEDRGLDDEGSAITVGAPTYSGTISFFREKTNKDASSPFFLAFEAFRDELQNGYLVVRVNKASSIAWEPGDEYSIFKFVSTNVADSTAGEASVKFTVTFLQQGWLEVNAILPGAGGISGIPATIDLSVGEAVQLEPVLSDKLVKSRVTVTSSNQLGLAARPGSVLLGLEPGEYTVTVAHRAASQSRTATVTVTA